MQSSSASTRADRLLQINDQLLDRLRGVSHEARTRRPVGDEWSVAEIVGHVIEMEPYWAESALRLAAQPGLEIGRQAEDPRRLSGPSSGGGLTPEQAIERLAAAGREAAAMLRRISDDAWSIAGRRLSGEPISVADIVQTSLVDHAAGHSEQVIAMLRD